MYINGCNRSFITSDGCHLGLFGALGVINFYRVYPFPGAFLGAPGKRTQDCGAFLAPAKHNRVTVVSLEAGAGAREAGAAPTMIQMATGQC